MAALERVLESLADDQDSVNDDELLLARDPPRRGELALYVRVSALEARGYSDFAPLQCGAFGCVYKARAPNNALIALKIGVVYGNEVDAQTTAARFGLAPAVLDFFPLALYQRDDDMQDVLRSVDFPEQTVALVSPLLTPLTDYLSMHGLTPSVFRALTALIERKEDYNIFHGDVHEGNTVVRVDERDPSVVREAQLVDWGFASAFFEFDSDAKRQTALVADNFLWMAQFLVRDGFVMSGTLGKFAQLAVALPDSNELRAAVLEYVRALVVRIMALDWALPFQKFEIKGLNSQFRWPRGKRTRTLVAIEWQRVLARDNTVRDDDQKYFVDYTALDAMRLQRRDEINARRRGVEF